MELWNYLGTHDLSSSLSGVVCPEGKKDIGGSFCICVKSISVVLTVLQGE